MNLKQYFTPQLQKKYSSGINQQVEVVQFGGHPRLDMGGLTQSGQIIEDIMNTAFRKLLPAGFRPRSVLILGFGAGSAAKLVSRKWPGCQITGVEIDPTVIQIGREHFAAADIPHLQLINADAYDYVLDLPASTSYDLTLVDCYLGGEFPKKLESPKFLKILADHSSQVLINRLFWADYKKTTLDFLDRLEKQFKVKTCRTPSNFLISLTAKAEL